MDNSKKGRKRFNLIRPHNKQKWTKEEDELLLEKAKENHFRHWKRVAKFLPGHTGVQCSGRYKRINPNLKKGSWTSEEDGKILGLINKYGRRWAKIAKELQHRSGKQVRDRYGNSLNCENNKTKFTVEEDNGILKYYNEYGKKWSKIAKFLKGRSDNMVKNRYYSCLQRDKIKDDQTKFEGELDLEREHEISDLNTKNATITELKEKEKDSKKNNNEQRNNNFNTRINSGSNVNSTYLNDNNDKLKLNQINCHNECNLNFYNESSLSSSSWFTQPLHCNDFLNLSVINYIFFGNLIHERNKTRLNALCNDNNK